MGTLDQYTTFQAVCLFALFWLVPVTLVRAARNQHVGAGNFALIAAAGVGMWLSASTVRAADDTYGGLHFTVPFTMDGVGVHAVFRDNFGEVRAGIDSRGIWQAGAGLSAGESDSAVGSAGVAYSSKQAGFVPYVGLRGGTGQYEVGVVSYGADFATTYGLVGAKVNWDDGDTQNGAQAGTDKRVHRPNDKVVNDNETDSGNSGNSGAVGDSGGSGGDSGQGGGSDTGSGTGTGDDDGNNSGGGRGNNDHGGNRSGLGDGTNPGKGKGRTNSPNTGQDNPHRVK